MTRILRDYLLDIEIAIEEVAEFTAGMTFEQFSADRKTINAVVRSIEVMGEAAKNVPDDFRNRYPQIPWKRIAGMRDKLIHEYHGVDLAIVWKTIQEEAPPLKPLLQNMLADLQDDET